MIQQQAYGQVQSDGSVVIVQRAPGLKGLIQNTDAAEDDSTAEDVNNAVLNLGSDVLQTVVEQAVGDQQVVLLDATTGSVINVYSADQSSAIQTEGLNIAEQPPSQVTEFLPNTLQSQSSQGKYIASKASNAKERQVRETAELTKVNEAKAEHSMNSNSITSLEKDIAQTLIEINPMSRTSDTSHKHS